MKAGQDRGNYFDFVFGSLDSISLAASEERFSVVTFDGDDGVTNMLVM
jgi:hypothetical protein